MNAEHRLVIIGTGTDDHEHVHKSLRTRLSSAGFDVTQRYHYPRVTQDDAEAAMEEDDLVVKESGWIRDIPNTFIESVLEAAEPTALIWGESAVVEGEFAELVTFADDLPTMPKSEAAILPPGMADKHDIPDTEFEDDSDPKNQHAPFSYDPEQDYYTEPENY